jgi:hypothetical protein
MNSKKEYLVKQKTLTGLTKWLNESNLKKQTGTEFNTRDVQNYIKRGYIPEYLGGHQIEKEISIQDVKLYNLYKK